RIGAFPGRGAARSDAPLIRDRCKGRVWNDPGSATHQKRVYARLARAMVASLCGALRPGNAGKGRYPQLRRTRAPISTGARAGFAAAAAPAAFGHAQRSNLSSKASGMKRVREA